MKVSKEQKRLEGEAADEVSTTVYMFTDRLGEIVTILATISLKRSAVRRARRLPGDRWSLHETIVAPSSGIVADIDEARRWVAGLGANHG